jgi:hypothetical protein
MEKPLKIELTELFMAKAGKRGWDRCFHGTIKRDVDEYGNPVVYGKIKVNDGYIIASAEDQWELGAKLDAIVLLVLDFNLNGMTVKKILAGGTGIFLN